MFFFFVLLRFYGSWDSDADLSNGMVGNISYHSVAWKKEVGKGSWVFHHVLRTSTKYPWLMLYFRSDATFGLSGGYHYPTRGMSKIVSNLSLPSLVGRWTDFLMSNTNQFAHSKETTISNKICQQEIIPTLKSIKCLENQKLWATAKNLFGRTVSYFS